MDDLRFIVQNEANLSHLSQPWVYFTDPSTNSDRGDGDIYRPLRTLSFALDRRVFGLDPFGYHLHSVLLHGLVALLFYLLLLGTLKPHARAAALGALLFVAHPLTTEAVCWISSRADLQVALFGLAGLIVARKAEQSRRLLLPAALLGLMAGFGKETAVMLPALYLVEHRLRAGRFRRSALAPFLSLAAGAGIYLLIYLDVRARGISGQVEFYGGSFSSHLPYGVVGVAKELRLALWPAGMNFLWEPLMFHPLPLGSLLLAALGLGLTAVLACVCWRRVPGVSCGLLWFFVALLPAANILLPLRSLLAERFAYLPLAGVAMAAAALLSRLQGRKALLAALVLLLPLATLTWLRAGDWSTQQRLYSSTLEQFPNSYAAHLGLGGVLLARGEALLVAGDSDAARPLLLDATEQFQTARELAADDRVPSLDATAASGRAFLLMDDLDRAIDILAEVDLALQEDPGLAELLQRPAEARFELGTALARQRQLDPARRVFLRLIQDHGRTARRLDALGEVYRAGHDAKALEMYAQALDIDPDYHDARIHRALLYLQLPGFESLGRAELREVLHRDPGNEKARKVLSEAGG
ncbi:MAG: tetratricopeptide repeat protein [Planctomycetota bacterium]